MIHYFAGKGVNCIFENLLLMQLMHAYVKALAKEASAIRFLD